MAIRTRNVLTKKSRLAPTLVLLQRRTSIDAIGRLDRSETGTICIVSQDRIAHIMRLPQLLTAADRDRTLGIGIATTTTAIVIVIATVNAIAIESAIGIAMEEEATSTTAAIEIDAMTIGQRSEPNCNLRYNNDFCLNSKLFVETRGFDSEGFGSESDISSSEAELPAYEICTQLGAGPCAVALCSQRVERALLLHIQRGTASRRICSQCGHCGSSQ